MIIGTGDIASVLKDDDNFIYFASGVSDSKCVSCIEFDREKNLLLSIKSDKHLVYFSTLSVYYSSTPYTQHKIVMENIVETFPKHTIVRIGNIIWGKNPNTLINYLKYRILNNLPYSIEDVYRFLISREEFLYWIELLKTYQTKEMNIPGERIKVVEIEKRIKSGLL